MNHLNLIVVFAVVLCIKDSFVCQDKETYKITAQIISGHECRERPDIKTTFMVSLRWYGQHVRYGKFFLHFCGSSLISSYWLLTAAHCLNDSMPMYAVQAAKVNTWRYTGEVKEINKKFPHPKFDYRHGQFDIGMLLLLNPINLDAKDYVKLPSKSLDSDYFPIISKKCELMDIMGFGVTSRDEKASFPNELMCASLKLMPFDYCLMWYNFVGFQNPELEVTPNYAQICIEGGLPNYFQGDSGGPCICDNVQYGIMSLSSGGLAVPSLMTRVDIFLDDFIKPVMKNTRVSGSTVLCHPPLYCLIFCACFLLVKTISNSH